MVKGQINKHNTVKLRFLRNYCKQDVWLKLSVLNWQEVLTSTDATKVWKLFEVYFHSRKTKDLMLVIIDQLVFFLLSQRSWKSCICATGRLSGEQ